MAEPVAVADGERELVVRDVVDPFGFALAAVVGTEVIDVVEVDCVVRVEVLVGRVADDVVLEMGVVVGVAGVVPGPTDSVGY